MTATTDGVKQLHGNLYRVNHSLISFAENKNEEGLIFFNPRHALGVSKPKGFSKEEMNELREAIRTEGLLKPLLLRWVEVNGVRSLQLVGGERRKRCIDKLLKENADCYDPASEGWKPAKEMYEDIDCRINEMDDQTAYKLAFSENERAIGIGDGATVALINEFRKASWTDEQILTATGKSVTWLKDTDVLLGLDEVTFKALVSDEINRSAALQLAQIEDITERVLVLENAKSFASGRITSMKQKLQKEVNSAENKVEFAKAELVEAEIKGNDEQKSEAEEKVVKNRKRAETKKKEAEELDENAVKITSKDIHKAKKVKESKSEVEEDLDDGKMLTSAKIIKFWYDPLVQIINRDGLDENGGDLEIDLADAKLIISLLEAREAGERDIISILQDHKLTKDDFVANSSVDDEDLDLDNDEIDSELDDDSIDDDLNVDLDKDNDD